MKNNSISNETTTAHTKTILSVNQINEALLRKYVNVRINSTNVKLQLDIGSDITIISEDMWKQLGQPSVRIAKDASGKPLHILSEIDCTVSLSGKTAITLLCYTKY